MSYMSKVRDNSSRPEADATWGGGGGGGRFGIG